MACPGAVALRPGAEVGLLLGVADGDGAAAGAGAGAVGPVGAEIGCVIRTGGAGCTGTALLGSGAVGLVEGVVAVAGGCAPATFCGASAPGSNGPTMFGPPRKALRTRPT